MKQLILVLLGLSFSGSGFAADLVEDIWCASTHYGQDLSKDQPATPVEVSYEELYATREMTRFGDTEVYTTAGKSLDRAGEMLRTYKAIRTTRRVELSEARYKEISSTESETIHLNPEVPARKSSTQTESVFEVQLDGTKKLVEQTKDGKAVELTGSWFSIVDRNGVEHTSEFTDQVTELPYGDGAVYKTILSKQICTITKR